MKPVNTSLTADELRRLIEYDPTSGLFRWRIGFSSHVKEWSEAGWLDSSTGYIRITISGKRYLAHRLGWLYMTGKWPIDQVDHIDLCRTNNRWANLRAASNSQNMANSRKYATNTSGYKGVSFHHQTGKWCAKIGTASKILYLGIFDSPRIAHAAYVDAANKYHGEFARAK